MKQIFYLLFVFLLLLQSCYEDKGNYDYQPVSRLEVSRGENSESYYRVMMGSEIQITPDIQLNGVAEENLQYEWQVFSKSENMEGKLLSTEQNLNAAIVERPGDYNIRFKVTDTATGLSSYLTYELQVTDGLSMAFLLLCRVPNTADEYDISAANEYATIGNIVRNVYSEVNGSTIKNATGLSYVTCARKKTDFLYLFKQHGGETLSSFDLAYQGDATDWFFEVPSDLSPTAMMGETYNGSHFLIVSNGGVYYIEGKYTPYKARLRLELNDGTNYQVAPGYASLANFGEYKNYIFWDKTHHRFIQWNSYAREMQTIDAIENVFDPSQIGDMEPLFLVGGTTNRCYCFMKDKAGNVHLYTFRNASNSYSNVVTEPLEHVLLPASLEIDKATTMYQSNSVEGIYYAVDNYIYLFNTLQKKRTPFYEDTDETTRFVKIFHKDKYSYTLFAAANRGNTGTFFRFMLDGSGNLVQPSDFLPQPWEEAGPYSEIVDMTYKYRDF